MGEDEVIEVDENEINKAGFGSAGVHRQENSDKTSSDGDNLSDLSKHIPLSSKRTRSLSRRSLVDVTIVVIHWYH